MRKVLIALFIFTANCIYSHDVEIDGVCYNINTIDNTAEVTYYGNIEPQINNNGGRGYEGDIIIPDTIEIKKRLLPVKSIGTSAFAYCESLKSVVLPNTIESIGSAAFQSCKQMEAIEIPSSVSSIGDRAFNYCISLSSIIIPSSVTNIGEYAFRRTAWYNNQPDGVIYAGKVAYEYKGYMEENTSITIKEGTTCICGYAFNEKPGLVSINIPNSVTNIGMCAFNGCTNLSSVDLGIGVECIGSQAFYRCLSLTSVELPNSVTSIGGAAFQECSNLQTINIPSNLKEIGWQTFTMCSSLSSIVIPSSVMWIEPSAFTDCSGLSSIIVEDTNTNYDSRGNCNAIIESATNKLIRGCKNTIVPNTITSIGFASFSACLGLATINIPNSVSIIEPNAFWGCTDLASIEIPNSVTSLGQYAFMNCSSLESLSIGRSVSLIDKGTFSGCQELNDVFCFNLPNIVAQDAFSNSFIEYSRLHVPSSQIEFFKLVAPWKDFGEIVELPSYQLKYVVDGTEYKSYDVEYGAIISPEAAPAKEGYTFSGWSEIPETMPAHNVTVTGTFAINKYKLTYTVDGEEYKTYEVEYGAIISPEAAPAKEGYTFSGWSEIPETMPAHDVTVTGSFNINSYKLTYMIDDKVYKETMYEYGATIIPEPQPEGDYDTFEWIDLPQTMPAHDVVVYASYTSGIVEVLMASQQNVRIYSPNGKKLNKLQKGLNIVILDDGTVKKVIMK